MYRLDCPLVRLLDRAIECPGHSVWVVLRRSHTPECADGEPVTGKRILAHAGHQHREDGASGAMIKYLLGTWVVSPLHMLDNLNEEFPLPLPSVVCGLIFRPHPQRLKGVG